MFAVPATFLIDRDGIVRSLTPTRITKPDLVT